MPAAQSIRSGGADMTTFLSYCAVGVPAYYALLLLVVLLCLIGISLMLITDNMQYDRRIAALEASLAEQLARLAPEERRG
jgi:uncharacterized membrane protein